MVTNSKHLNKESAKVMGMQIKVLIVLLFALMMIPVAFGVEVNSSTEIYTFNVTGCQANETSVGCADAWIRFECNISNYAYIDYVDFEIDSIEHETDRNLNYFWYDWHKGITTEDVDTEIEFDKVKIYDVSEGISQYFPSISVDLLCDACDYNVTYGSCNPYDQRLVQYVGDGSANCTSYNVTESCDYCTPDWSITSDCLLNNTEFREYSDDNSCYSLTGLYSDSCDYEYTDCDTWISCSYLQDDLNCGYDENPLIELVGNRIFWYCSLEDTYIDANCISYVKEDNFVIQTNPQQKTFSTGLFSKEQETREFFTAENGLVNPYFTTDNLKTNRTYIFGVECSYEGGKSVEEHYVTPLYQDLDVVADRTLWVKQNTGFIIGILVVIAFIGILFIWVKPK